MIFVKIDEKEYQASISGRMNDTDWDNRESKSIKTDMDYETAKSLFVNGCKWSIIMRDFRPIYDQEGHETGEVEVVEQKFDNSDYNLAGDITDHRDGTVTVKMGKLTDLEQAYEMILGGAI